MTNKLLLSIEQGAPGWNQWRQEYQDILPDLDRAFLNAINLEGVNLKGALRQANYRKANFSNSNRSQQT